MAADRAVPHVLGQGCTGREELARLGRRLLGQLDADPARRAGHRGALPRVAGDAAYECIRYRGIRSVFTVGPETTRRISGAFGAQAARAGQDRARAVAGSFGEVERRRSPTWLQQHTGSGHHQAHHELCAEQHLQMRACRCFGTASAPVTRTRHLRNCAESNAHTALRHAHRSRSRSAGPPRGG